MLAEAVNHLSGKEQPSTMMALTLIATQCDARSSVNIDPSTIVPFVNTVFNSRRTIPFPFAAAAFPFVSLTRISAPSAVSH